MRNTGFSPEWLDELKRKNDIVSVVSKYVQLEQRGNKFWGCCPFHREKTPSFVVDQYDGLFHCFGCKEGGDVISFVEKIESCNFHDAVVRLAELAKMPLPEMTGDENLLQRKKERDTILKILDLAKKHYHQNIYLPAAKPAQDYIKMRGFSRHELEDFEIGYSLNWNELTNFLIKQGFSAKQLVDSGVAQSKEPGKIYDAMGGRLVFPIINSFGDCIGFTARALEKTDYAKYKNTAETRVFQKSKVVFAINLLKKLKQEKGLSNIIIVEGQIDVISMHRAGFKNTVACLGTALTADHARELKRLCENIILCFDGDEAGEKATLRAIPILQEAGCNVKVARLPKGIDPDELLKAEGSEGVKKVIDASTGVIDYHIALALEKYDLSKPDQRGEFTKEVLSKLKNLSAAEQDPYLFKLRDLTQTPVDTLRRSLGISIMPTFEKPEKTVLVERINGNKRAVRFILASILHKKDFVDDKIDYSKLLQEQTDVLELIKSVSRVSGLFDRVDVDDPFWQEIIYFNFAEAKGSEKQYFDECIWSIVEEKLKEEKDQIMISYKASQSLEERKQLLVKAQAVDKKIRDKNLQDFYIQNGGENNV